MEPPPEGMTNTGTLAIDVLDGTADGSPGRTVVPGRRRPRLSAVLAAVLAGDALLHLWWTAGPSWPFADQHRASLAVLGFAVPFTAGVLLPLAAVLLFSATMVFALGRVRPDHKGHRLFRLTTAGVTAGLLLRGLFGVVWAAAADGSSAQPFAALNLWVYTPVCLALAVVGWLLVADGRGRSGRRWGPLRLAVVALPVLVVGGTLGVAYGMPPREQSGYQPEQGLDGIRSRFLDTPLARFHYLREGSGSPVVLLSPGAAWAAAWLPELRALSTNHTVYVVDLPGQGFTTVKDRRFRYDLDGMTKAVGTFMDAAAVPSAALAGNSWSGGWALAFAQRHPERVNSLMLLDSSGLDRPDPIGWEVLKLPVLGRALTNLSVRSRSVTESGVRGLFVHQALVTPELVDGFWAAATRPQNVRAGYELEARLDWSVTDAMLERTTVPTLVLWGKQDSVLPPAQAAEFGARLPDARVQVLDGCGHAITLDRAARVTTGMTGFLDAR